MEVNVIATIVAVTVLIFETISYKVFLMMVRKIMIERLVTKNQTPVVLAEDFEYYNLPFSLY